MHNAHTKKIVLVSTIVAALCLSAAAGCGGSARPTTTGAAPSSKALRPPRTVQVRRLRPSASGYLRPGTRVSNRFAGTRVFANPRDGFAIGTPPRATGDTYPLATLDGGKTWRTAGPVLHIPAAQAAVDVTEAGTGGPHVWYAWGQGITVVDVTPDAGKHWWQAFFPGMVLTVYAEQGQCNRLIALIQPFTKRKQPPLWTYASANGRHWTYVFNPSTAAHC